MVERRASAVSFYPTDHPALNITVKSRMVALLREKQEDLASGLANDWADYRYRCGIMNGLSTAIAMCDEVIREMSER
jgi:hypothetical protein